MNKNFNKSQTNPVLINALSLMKTYVRATKTRIAIYDHNYKIIPEMEDDILKNDNPCIFCSKYQKNLEVNNLQDLTYNPCMECTINSINESCQSGISSSKTCPLGFNFWFSPIYMDEQFIGAIAGSSLTEENSEEVFKKMHEMCRGEIKKDEIKKIFSAYPKVRKEKINSLSELMLICAESLSVRSGGCHEAMKRQALQEMDLSAKIEDLKMRHPAGSPLPEYPMYKEKELVEKLRQGETRSAKLILNDILAVLFFTGAKDFKFIQYRIIELIVLISRAGSSSGINAKTVLETNNSYINEIQEASDIEELTLSISRIIDDLSMQINSFQGIHHPSALKRAEYFILENFTRKISLEEIAKASGFSAPYFSTIFKEEMGENLSRYLNRLRVEKARIMLTETNYALSEIARASGFEDQSWFSKIFKQYTGISPGKYRSQGGKTLYQGFVSCS